MKNALADIRDKLRNGYYQNEEHVRFSLVARLLQELGWDIWNPKEVNAEFVAVPSEDRTKVDVALFANTLAPSVFIEVKSPGKIANLEQIESQLRDYNRNITSPFCIITNGSMWRFYYSQTAGDFHSKCFKILNLESDDLADVELALATFLLKTAIVNGTAEEQAKTFLKLSQKQKAMEECLPKARRMVQEPPFPSLPEALVGLLSEKGIAVSKDEAQDFIAQSARKSSQQSTNSGEVQKTVGLPLGPIRTVPPVRQQYPEDLGHTNIIEATIGSESANNWNNLVRAGLKIAAQRGYLIPDMRKIITAQLKEGVVTQQGFHVVPGADLSVQYTPANTAWRNACALAKELGVRVSVRFQWRNREGAAFPGKETLIEFP
jgi:hypothetical protein